MSRYFVTAGGTVTGSGYAQPARVHKKGDVVELSAAEVTMLNAAGITLRAVSTATTHDQSGEAAAVSNGS